MLSSIFNSLCKSLLAELRFCPWLKRRVPFRVKQALYKEDVRRSCQRSDLYFFFHKSLIWFNFSSLNHLS